MSTINPLQFPFTSYTLLSDPLAMDRIQQHWLRIGTQFQRNWIDNTLGFFTNCQTLTRDGQKLQGIFFDGYMDWVKRWGSVVTSPAFAQQKVSEDAEEEVIETPLLLGWVVDDLTRIRGIGKVQQERLYREGIVSYLQITQLDESEIARIENEVLGTRFAGHILRQQWQAQAKELMNG